MEISPVIQQFLTSYGLVMAGVLCAMQLLSWTMTPNIWVAEITDGKEKGDNKGYAMYLIIFYSIITAFLVYVDGQLLNYSINMLSQTSLFVFNLMMVGIYVLIDLIIIDLILYVRIKPGFMQLPGIAPVTDYFHHLKYAVRTFIVGGVFAFVASILATL